MTKGQTIGVALLALCAQNHWYTHSNVSLALCGLLVFGLVYSCDD